MVIRSLFLCAVWCSLFMGTAWADTATLTWNANTETDLAGYKVYRSTVSGQYGAPVATLGKVATYTVDLPQGTADTRYFLTLTAYDKTGNESPKSTEVNKLIVAAVVVTRPIAPVLTAVVVPPTSITVTWPASAGVKTELRWAVKGTGWGASTPAACATSPCTIPGLTPGTTYELQAVNYVGTPNVDAVFSPLSAVVSVTMPSTPVVPGPATSCLEVTTANTKKEVTIRAVPCAN